MPIPIGLAITSLSLVRSSSPSQRATTTQATPLPTRLVRARHSDMNLSMPSTRVIAATGTGLFGMAERVAARVMKPAPVTPEAPFEVSIATRMIVAYWPIDRSAPTACARKRVVSVM